MTSGTIPSMNGNERERAKTLSVLMEVLEAAERYRSRTEHDSFVLNELSRRGYYLGPVQQCQLCGDLTTNGRVHQRLHLRRTEP